MKKELLNILFGYYADNNVRLIKYRIRINLWKILQMIGITLLSS